MNTNRNKPCPCGSGRKYKKCCIDKKQRITTVTGLFDSQQLVNNISIDFNTGVVKFGLDDKPISLGKVTSDFGYEREKGQKVLSRFFPKENEHMLHPNSVFLRYKNIVAIDTNTKSVDGCKLSVAVAVLGKPEFKNGKFLIGSLRWTAYEFWEPKKNPEHIGWKMMLAAILEQPEYKSGEDYGVIVDSDLSNIEKYNERQQGLFGDSHILPPNITFLYASSDSKNDSALNSMIHRADKISNVIHSKIANQGFKKPVDNLQAHEIEWYSAIRNWFDVEGI